VTIEEGAAGGFGAHVLHYLAAARLLDTGLRVRTMTLPDRFIDHDKPDVMYRDAGLDSEAIVGTVFAALGRERITGESADRA